MKILNEQISKKVKDFKLNEEKINNIDDSKFIYITDDGSSFLSLKEALEWVNSEDGSLCEEIIKKQVDTDEDELSLCEDTIVWTRAEGEVKKNMLNESMSLKEGAANFYTPKYLPLLVFFTDDEVQSMMEYDEKHPKYKDFENEDDYYNAVEEYEENFYNNLDAAALGEFDLDNLEDDLREFNIETKNIAYDKDIDEEGWQAYGNNLNLEDIQLEIKPGYYEAAQIYINHEEEFEDLDEDFRKEQLERFNKFLKELKEKYGLTQLTRVGSASNGETFYDVVKEGIGDFEEDDELYIYLFPVCKAIEPITDAKKFNLEILGRNEFEDEHNYVVEGTRTDLIRFANYVDYDLHPDYLYKEEDFAGEILPLKGKKVREGYSLLGAEDKNIELYSNYYTAKERAEELGLKEAEYGDVYNSDIAYCYWNKSGNRNDDEEVICYYFFENGKPKHYVSQEELSRIASVAGVSIDKIDDADDVDLEENLNESQSQEIAATYRKLSDLYGVDMDELVYGEGGFMKTKYPQGFPDFAGDVIFSEKYWDEFEKWCKEKGITLDDKGNKYLESLKEEVKPLYRVVKDGKGKYFILKRTNDIKNGVFKNDHSKETFDTPEEAKKAMENPSSLHFHFDESLKEDIEEWDADFDICCQDVADGLDGGWWHGQTRSGRNWGLSVNGKDGNQFSPKFADVVAYECSYPVRDGYFNFAGLDCIPNKSTFYYTNFDNESEREVIRTDLLNVGCSEEEIDAFFNGDENAEIEFYIDYYIDIDDLEEFEENLKEGTVKQGKNWVNKGKEGTHGKFKTKKEANAQRKAMFANGFKENLNEDYSGFLGNYGFDYLRGIGDFEYWYFKDEKGFEEAVERIRKEYPKLIVSSSPSDKTIYIQKSKYGTKEPVTESKKEVKPFTKSQVMAEIKRDTVNFSKDFEGHYGFEEEANIAEKILTKRGYEVDYHTDDSKLERGKTEYIIVATKTHINEGLEEGDVEYKGFTIKPLVIDSIMYGDKKLPGFTKYVIMKGDKYLPDKVYDLFKKDNKLETIDDYKKLIDNIKIKEGLTEANNENEQRIILCCNSDMSTVRNYCIEGIAYISKEPIEREIEFAKNWFDHDAGYDEDKSSEYNVEEYVNFFDYDDGNHYIEWGEDNSILLYEKGEPEDKLIKTIHFDAMYDNQEYSDGKYGPIDESLKEDLEQDLTVLAKDEQEAIDGYDKIINKNKGKKIVKSLQHIRDEEDAHLNYLNNAKTNPDLKYDHLDESKESYIGKKLSIKEMFEIKDCAGWIFTDGDDSRCYGSNSNDLGLIDIVNEDPDITDTMRVKELIPLDDDFYIFVGKFANGLTIDDLPENEIETKQELIDQIKKSWRIDESLKEGLEQDYSNIDLIDKFEFKNRKTTNVEGISNMRDFIDSLNKVGKDTFKCRTTTFGNNVSWGDIKFSLPELRRNGWRIGRAWDSSLPGFNEVYICKKESLKEDTNSMKDKVVKTTNNYTKEKGVIVCNKGTQQQEVEKLLAPHYTTEILRGKNGRVQVKFVKKLEEAKKDKKKKKPRFVGDMNAEMKFFNDGNSGNLGGASAE